MNVFQLACLKLKRHRCGEDEVEIKAEIILPIGRCWLLGIGSKTIFLLSDAMLIMSY